MFHTLPIKLVSALLNGENYIKPGNALCLTKSQGPDNIHNNFGSGFIAKGAVYHSFRSLKFKDRLYDAIPCALCGVRRRGVIMIPGKSACSSIWHVPQCISNSLVLCQKILACYKIYVLFVGLH